MAPKFAVIYFDSPGNAEPIRWALAQSGLEWEDKRLYQEEFKVLKPTLPNGHLPILEVDGYLLPQTMAILRYVGKLGGLYPTDDFEAAKCDAVMDSTVDLVIKLLPLIFEQDEAKKTEIRKELVTNYTPTWLGNMEKQLEQTDGLYFLNKLTVADIAVASRLWWFLSGLFEGVSASIVDAYPKLLALTKSVLAEAKITEFLAKTKASK